MRSTTPIRRDLMRFVVICRDVADSAPRRDSSLDDHRRYVDQRSQSLVASGPLVADDSDRRIGQFFLLDVEDRAAAESFVAEDPFTLAGVFERVEVSRLLPKFDSGRRV